MATATPSISVPFKPSTDPVSFPDLTSLPPFYVYRTKNGNGERITIEFYLKSPKSNSRMRRFRFDRKISEPLHLLVDRILRNTNRTFSKPARKNKTTTNGGTFLISSALFYRTNGSIRTGQLFSEVDTSSLLGDLFFPSTCSDESVEFSNCLLRLNGSDQFDITFRLQRNPARISKCRLDTIPMVGCPIMPTIEIQNVCLFRSEFLWFVTETIHWPNEPVHQGLVFTPSEHHVGSRVRLIVRPRDASGQLGIPYGDLDYCSDNQELVECQMPIARGPVLKYVEERLASATQHVDNQFRVVSYNVLADMYSSTEAAQNMIFRHCPLEYLSQTYRLPLILRELVAYQPDLLCLQEVDQSVFESWLKPVLNYMLDMQGIFLSKRKIAQNPCAPAGLLPTNEEKGEGCAVFYRTSRFSLIREYHLPSILSSDFSTSDQVQKRLEQFSESLEPSIEPSSPTFVMHKQKAAAHCLAVALFRMNRAASDRNEPDHELLLVGNTHFYFDPGATYWRVAQACIVRAHLDRVTAEVTQEFGCPPSLVLCGDMNSSPDTPVYTALVSDARDAPSPSGQLQSAYSLSDAAFTNWVPGFRAVLDYILYDTANGLQCHQRLPLCSQQRICELLRQTGLPMPPDSRGPPVDEQDVFALPNSEFPSDHLSLVADFCWNADKNAK